MTDRQQKPDQPGPTVETLIGEIPHFGPRDLETLITALAGISGPGFEQAIEQTLADNPKIAAHLIASLHPAMHGSNELTHLWQLAIVNCAALIILDRLSTDPAFERDTGALLLRLLRQHGRMRRIPAPSQKRGPGGSKRGPGGPNSAA
jgi:hypothetical protein